jgi:hypothetical protein
VRPGKGASFEVRSLSTFIVFVLAIAGCGYEPTSASSAALGERTDRCEIFGSGTLGQNVFEGAARGGEGGTEGSWTNDAGGTVTLGDADFITCRINGVLLGDLMGPASYDGEPGYRFLVSVEDFGDAVAERHAGHTTVQTLTATRYYSPSRWEDGTLAVDESSTVTIPSELPVTVGNAGNQWAWLTFERADTGDVVSCRYRGGASRSCPSTPEDLAAGESYTLARCVGEDEGTAQVDAGDRVEVSWMTLHVQSGAHTLPSDSAAQTTVSVELAVAPQAPSQGDYYHLVVEDLDAPGEPVYETDGFLDSGDLTVRYLQ